MATLKPNSFTSYELTEDEELQASILTTLQLQLMNNHLAVSAEEKINLDFTPKDVEGFLQKEAALNATIKILTYIIELSESSLNTVINKNTPNGDNI